MPRDLAPLLQALADELDSARRDLEALAEILGADSDFALRNLQILQAVDHIGQRQAVTAAVLRAPDPLAAAASVSLEAMQDRLAFVLQAAA